MWVQYLSQEDPLKGEMATTPVILAQKIPQTEEQAAVTWVAKELDTTERLNNTESTATPLLFEKA